MTINQEAFYYIKEQFTTKQQVDDYVLEIQQITLNANSNALENAALAKLQTVLPGFEGTVGVWAGKRIPWGIKIAPPDFSDIAWRNAAIRALKRQDTRTGENPVDYIVKEILKKFDEKIPTKNIDLTDIAYAKAFEAWYVGIGKSGSCWSAIESATIMASFIAQRVKDFNIGIDNPEDTP
jgi:hypothetical protein